jgi:hypothetical protein
MLNDSVRRSVSIPILSEGENVLAVSEVGAKLWSKDIIYRKFFEKGLAGVKDEIMGEIERRGGGASDFKEMLSTAEKKLKSQGLTREPVKKSKSKSKKRQLN